MEKRLQLWSPVWGWLATKEGESVDLKGRNCHPRGTGAGKIVLQKKVGTIQSDGLL